MHRNARDYKTGSIIRPGSQNNLCLALKNIEIQLTALAVVAFSIGPHHE
jgi:hypothetical protein